MIRKPSNWAKPATTAANQVSILESRNMTVADKNAAENILRRVNYYRFCHYANSLVTFSKTEIKSVIKSLADLRNQCAHHRKILFSNFNSTPAITQDMRALQIDGSKIGAFIFCLHKMMKNDADMQSSFYKKISELYKKCPSDIKNEFGTGSFL